MQARYYDPVIGRFIAVDPVMSISTMPMSFGRYLYVNNNPYKFIDPTGMVKVKSSADLARERSNARCGANCTVVRTGLPRDRRVDENGNIATGVTFPTADSPALGNIVSDGIKDPTQTFVEWEAKIVLGAVACAAGLCPAVWRASNSIVAASATAKTEAGLGAVSMANALGGAPAGATALEAATFNEIMALGTIRQAVVAEEFLRNSAIGPFLATMGLIAD